MQSPIRVLHVFATLDCGGAETMIMNIYRKINKDKVQFDFIANDSGYEYVYENEIKTLGGKIFKIPKYRIGNHKAYKHTWLQILEEHPEWKTIHAHHTSTAQIYFGIAKKTSKNYNRT